VIEPAVAQAADAAERALTDAAHSAASVVPPEALTAAAAGARHRGGEHNTPAALDDELVQAAVALAAADRLSRAAEARAREVVGPPGAPGRSGRLLAIASLLGVARQTLAVRLFGRA
jgi:hypothetical protein